MIREQVQRNIEDYRTTWITAGVLVLFAGAFAGGYATGRRAERLEGERMVAQVEPPDDVSGATNSNRLNFYADLVKDHRDGPDDAASPSPVADKVAVAEKAVAAPAKPAASPDRLATTTVAHKDTPERPSLIKPADRVVGSVGEALTRGPALPGEYTVQVSSFQTNAEARAFASALERKGFKPFVVSAELPGKGTWHRVRLGRFASEDEARAAKGVLARSDIPAWVLRSD